MKQADAGNYKLTPQVEKQIPGAHKSCHPGVVAGKETSGGNLEKTKCKGEQKVRSDGWNKVR